MYMNRQLINQLRVAYFIPTRNSNSLSTCHEYNVSSMCTSTTVRNYGSCSFGTPVVPFVGSIPSITTQGGLVQAPSVIPSNTYQIHYSSPQPFCVPSRYIITRKSSQSDSRAYSLALLDYTFVFRNGYINAFHQQGRQLLSYPMLLDQPYNIFF